MVQMVLAMYADSPSAGVGGVTEEIVPVAHCHCDWLAAFSISFQPHILFSIVTPFLQSTCSTRLNLLARLVYVAEFVTIIPNES